MDTTDSYKSKIHTLKTKLEHMFPAVRFTLRGSDVIAEDKELFRKYYWDTFDEQPKARTDLRRKLKEPDLVILTPDECSGTILFTID